MSIYVDQQCLLHAVRSNNANEVAFIMRHTPENFVSNTHLMIAIEEGNIAAARELLIRWHPFDDISLSLLIDLVDDATFAGNAIKQIGKEIMPFDQLIVQAARLGRVCWVKELAHLAEDELWNAPSFKEEVDFWTNAIHEQPAVVQLLLSHMSINPDALRPALKEAQQYNADVVDLLMARVQRLDTIEQAQMYATDKNIEALKFLLSTMSSDEIYEAYCDADGDARSPSVWVAAVPTLKVLGDSIPWLLASALRNNEMEVVPKLLPLYRVVETSEREERKHEPNVVRAALGNLVGLQTVLKVLPANHPHVVAAIDTAAKNKNMEAVNELLSHSPNLRAQALLSSLSSYSKNGTTVLSRFLLEQSSDHELMMCVRLIDKKKSDFTDMDLLHDIIEPRVERWKIQQHIDRDNNTVGRGTGAPKRKL